MPDIPHARFNGFSFRVTFGRLDVEVSLEPMNTTTLQPSKLPGFKVVPKRHLEDVFSPTQSAYYVLLGRRGAPASPRERVLFVHYLDHFLSGCQQQIEELWTKHRVHITHVAVKLRKELQSSRHDFAETYERAVAIQQLRQKLQPRFRRL
jgi:hypothetical protein